MIAKTKKLFIAGCDRGNKECKRCHWSDGQKYQEKNTFKPWPKEEPSVHRVYFPFYVTIVLDILIYNFLPMYHITYVFCSKNM